MNKTNYENTKVGMLSILEKCNAPQHIKNKHQTFYKCKCDCGRESVIRGSSITDVIKKSANRNRPVSCGCLFGKYKHLLFGLGDVVGYLTLVEKQDEHGQRTKYVCQCVCGKKVIRKRYVLIKAKKSGSISTCGECDYNKGQNNKNARMCGKIPQHYLSRIKLNAKKRGYEYDLSDEYLNRLLSKQNEKCALTGTEIGFDIDSSVENREVTASLDRKNSSIGYIRGNVQWIHKDINWMKQDYTNEEFIENCKRVAKYMQ